MTDMKSTSTENYALDAPCLTDFVRTESASAMSSDTDSSQESSGSASPVNFGTDTKSGSSGKALKRSLSGLVVEVEGNIGSGKSTIIRALEKWFCGDAPKGVVPKLRSAAPAIVFGENIDNKFLAAFYRDPKTYAFAFQMYMVNMRMAQMREAAALAKDGGKFVLLDRGAVGDSLFAWLNHTSGRITDEQFAIYKSVCQGRMPASLSDEVDIVIYLDVAPAECHRRVTQLRQNDAEKGIPLEYLDLVDKTYFHLFVEWISGCSRGTFPNLNIGTAPPVGVCRWHRYGTEEQILRKIDDLNTARIPSPTIAFQKGGLRPVVDDAEQVVLDTEASVASAYAQLLKDDHIFPASCSSAAINWELEHTNAFRRVSMYFMSLAGNIVFYSAD